MTILAFAGFESGDVAEFNTKNTGVTTALNIKTTHPRSGTYEVRLFSTTSASQWGALNYTAGATRAARFGFYIAALPNNGPEEFFGTDGNTVQEFSLRVGTDGKIRVYGRVTTTLLTTGTKVLVTGQYYKIDVKYTNNSNTGKTVAVKVNNELPGDINFTWSETTADFLDAFVGCGGNKNVSTYDYYFDDFAVADDWVPDMLIPSSIVTSTNLAGTIAALVEPVDVSTASWLTASSAVAATDVRVGFATPANNLL
jgi:hypothetical protein